MKKGSVIILIVLFIFTLTGCSRVKLEESQSFTTFKSNGDVIMSTYISDKDADDSFNVDTTDKKSKIEDDLVDAFDDFDMDVKVSKIKANKDYLKFTITSEDSENLGFDSDYTLEDYAEDNYYEDVEALAESEEFIYFKNEDDVKEKDLADYEENSVMTVSGGEEGNYYKLPGKILLLSDIDFERISSDTIFVDSEEYGIIVYKN